MADDQKIAKIFLSIRSGLARAVMGIVPPRDVEDVVQESYVRVCQAEKKGAIRDPRSFLYRTVRNLALDQVKSAQSRLVISVEDDRAAGYEDEQRNADETVQQVSSHEEFAIFCEAVRCLPVQCRRAFVLKKVYGYTQKEIACELGLSESTVEKHIAQGVKRCTLFIMDHDKSGADIGRRSTLTNARQGSRS